MPMCTDTIPAGLIVVRGAYGTVPAAHDKGETLYHLTQRYNGFLPDPNTSLLDEIAGNIASEYGQYCLCGH